MSDSPQPPAASRQIPGELVRRGVSEAVHDLPPGAEVNCARALVMAFGEEIRALVTKGQGA